MSLAIWFCLAALVAVANAQEVKVWLTVSSAKHKINGVKTTRLLELNYLNAPLNGGDWIGLFDKAVGSTTNSKEALIAIYSLEGKEGKILTHFEFPIHEFDKSALNSKCLGYYLAYVSSDGQVLAQNCIKPQPFWMADNFEYIKDKSLRGLMIPGTHDAATYKYTPGMLIPFGGRVQKYAVCQDETIFNQLVYGIRFLDLRVMLKESSKKGPMGEPIKFWMAHDFLQMDTSLNEVLQQVKDFLDNTQKEVVILDFHRFPKGFDDKNEEVLRQKHQEVFDLIQLYLKDHLALNTNDFYMKIGDLVNSGKRAVIGYSEKKVIPENQYLLPRAGHLWAETDKLDGLKAYFDEKVCKTNYYVAEAAMAQLTPTIGGISLDSYHGVRKMADDVNAEITKWFRDIWSDCANVVATDYFLGNNIIEVAIEANRKRRN